MEFGWDNPVIELGLWSFLPGDAFNVALAALAHPSIWCLTHHR